MTHLETFTVDAGTASLAIDHLAGSGPPWVFLHGLASTRNGTKGEALLDHAQRNGRALYRFDFRGHGDSSGAIEATTLSQLCDDTRAVLRATGPAILIGSSLGGLVAAWSAAKNPEHVVALVLIAPAFGMVEKLHRERTLVTTAGESICGFELGDHVLQDADKFDEAGLPAQLTMPTLAIHGGSDDVVRATSTGLLFESIPHRQKELWVVRDADHSLNLRFDDVLGRIDRFLARR